MIPIPNIKTAVAISGPITKPREYQGTLTYTLNHSPPNHLSQQVRQRHKLNWQLYAHHIEQGTIKAYIKALVRQINRAYTLGQNKRESGYDALEWRINYDSQALAVVQQVMMQTSCVQHSVKIIPNKACAGIVCRL